MSRDRIVEGVNAAVESLPMAARLYPDTWHIYGDPVTCAVEALIREAVRDALTQAASIAAMPGLGNEYAIMAYRDEHYPEP